jgi:hypothetical protein
MASDLTIVVADVTRSAAIRSAMRLPGRIVHFTNSNLALPLEAIRTQQPSVVAIDAVLMQTQQGLGFLKRVEGLAIPGCTIQLIVRNSGTWTTTAHDVPPAKDATPVVGAPTLASPSRSAIVAAPKTGTNTRRASRFAMASTLDAVVEGGQASLIDISVLGAQLVSQPVLRPGQTVKITLPDAGEILRLTANVAWSTFLQSKQGTAVYRAGVAFTDATQETLEDYCRRYGAATPLASF